MKVYKLLVLLFALHASSLVAMATARNDIWQTAVPMSSSPATTFRSTSAYHSNRSATTIHYTSPYSSSRRSGNYNASANNSYRAASGVCYKAYQSSSSIMRSYGGNSYSNYTPNGTYNSSHRYSASSTTYPIAASSVATPVLADAPADMAKLKTTHSTKLSWRGAKPSSPGTYPGEVSDDGEWTWNGTEWVASSTEPGLEIGDKKYEGGQWWVWNGTAWVPEAAEPVPFGAVPYIFIVLLAAAYMMKKNLTTKCYT